MSPTDENNKPTAKKIHGYFRRAKMDPQHVLERPYITDINMKIPPISVADNPN